MQAFTVVTLVDSDGDEFPVRLPGAYLDNEGEDIAAAQRISKEMAAAGEINPKGELTFFGIDYYGAS